MILTIKEILNLKINKLQFILEVIVLIILLTNVQDLALKFGTNMT